MSNAKQQFGIFFWLKIAGSFAKIAEVVSYGLPGLDRTLINVTSLDATNGFMDYIKNKVKEYKEFMIGVNWDPAAVTHDAAAGMQAAAESDDASDIRISIPTSPAWNWDMKALVRGWDLSQSADMAKQFIMQFPIKPTGQITMTQV